MLAPAHSVAAAVTRAASRHRQHAEIAPPHVSLVRTNRVQYTTCDATQKMADRIRAHAIRRCGVLLSEIEPGQGARDGKREEAPTRR